MNVKKYILKSAKLILATYCLMSYRRKIDERNCDILFLYDWAGEIDRTVNLSLALESKGFKVLHERIPSPLEILRNRLLLKTKRISTLQNCLCEYYAAYVVNKYRPQILLTFDDGTRYTEYLKKEMEKIGGKIINIAHGITGDSELFTNFHYHYYFVFGQSSIDAVFRQKTRYGNTRLVKTGSYLLDENYYLPDNRNSKKILFFSTWLPDKVRDILLKNIELLAEWATLQNSYQLLVKHHPLEDESIIKSILRNASNTKFLTKETKMKDALQDVSLVFTCWSVASIEAALLNRPTVIINNSNLPDFLEIEKYYLPRARTVTEINSRIEEVFVRYDEFIGNAQKFVNRHLEHKRDSIPFIANCIKSICENKEEFECIPINVTMDSKL